MRLILLTALTMVAFAANSVLNRMAVGAGAIDPQGFAVIRLAAGALMLALVLGLRHRLSGRAIWPGWRGRSGGVAGLLVYLFGFSTAYTQLSAGTGALILFGAVQIAMFGGALWSAEPIRVSRWIGAGMAFAGLGVLVAPQVQGASGPAMAAMALAGLGWGVYSLAGRQSGDALAATSWNFILALPPAVAFWAVASAANAPDWTGFGIALAGLSGAVSSALGYALWYQLMPRLGAARAAVAQLTVPVIAAAGGLVLMGEAVSLRFVLSAVVVLGGVAVASR